MRIRINAKAAVQKNRTGVEEYAYQVIKHLTLLPEAKAHQFFLLVPKGRHEGFDFPLPENFTIKELYWPLPFFWSQIRLTLEMLLNPRDVFFVHVHVLPFFCPKNSVATIHGLEYEHFPQHYPRWGYYYLRWNTKNVLRRARKIIAVSESTKHDLVKLYKGRADKISVVLHGYDVRKGELSEKGPETQAPSNPSLCSHKNSNLPQNIKKPYLLYIGRIETKKNIQGMLEAFTILKEKFHVPHKLVLAGGKGYGYKILHSQLANFKNKADVILTGYFPQAEKQPLLSNAEVFVFPSFYEGFGIPILEAQASDLPVVTSFVSSMPEVAGGGALFIDPNNPTQIAEAVYKIISDKAVRDSLIALGQENIKQFSWEKCARETLNAIVATRSIT